MKRSESKYFNTALLMDEALLQLLEKKDFPFIGVKEVCKKAGVNRSTFYLHYESLNDLLDEAIAMLNERFVSSFPEDLIKDIGNEILTSPKYLTPYLTFVKENRRAYRLIHDKPELFSAEAAFRKMYRDVFDPALDHFHVDEKEKDYIFDFYTKGTLAIIQKWVANDCKEEIPFLVDLIARLTFANERKA